VLNPSFITLAESHGAAQVATLLVMITGVANALGRLCAPMLADKIGCEKAAISITITTAFCALALCFAHGWLFVAAVAIAAFCYGGFPGLYPVLTADYFGIKNVGANYGAVMIGFALSALCWPMLISMIGSDENPTMRFIALASLAGIATLLVVVLMLGKKKTVVSE